MQTVPVQQESVQRMPNVRLIEYAIVQGFRRQTHAQDGQVTSRRGTIDS
jgi:hypothetical protein